MWRRLLISLITGVAFAFSVMSVWVSCRFYEYQSEGGTISSAGLFAFSYRHEQCVKYGDVFAEWRELVEFDPSTKAAQAFGAMATIFGALACLLTVFGSCFLSFFHLSKKTWRTIISGSLLTAFACQSLTFLVFVQLDNEVDCGAGDNQCSLGIGGICSLVAACLYLVAGLGAALLALQKPKENARTTYLARHGTKMMRSMGMTWRHQPLRHMRLVDIGFLAVSIFLMLLSFTVLLNCKFFTVNFNNNTREYSEGLLYYHYYPDDSCRSFERGSLSSFSATTRAAIAFALLAVVFGALILYFLWTMIFLLNYPPVVYKMLPLLSFFAALSQSLTFLSNSERNDNLCAEDIVDQSCELGPDALVATCAVCLYMVFIPALWWFGKNPNILNAPSEQGDGAEQGEAGIVEKEKEASSTLVKEDPAEVPRDSPIVMGVDEETEKDHFS